MAKFRFNCSDYDKHGDPIPGTGHGELSSCAVHLYSYLDRAGEQIYISLGTDGKFFFSEEQEKYLEVYWSKDAIINLVDRNSNHGRNLDFEQCPHPNCQNDVGVELIEEEPQ